MRFSSSCRLGIAAVVASACLGLASPAAASVHLWTISEIYSSSDGSVQYVELFTNSPGQEYFVSFGNNTQLRSKTHPGNVVDETYAFTSDSGAPTTNKHVLVGTSNLSGIAGVTPDYTIPANFLIIGPGRVDFFSPVWGSFGSQTYAAGLPGGNMAHYTNTDGGGSGLLVGTPTNFAGTVGTLPPPVLPDADFDDDTDIDADDINILADIIFRGASDPGGDDTADLDGVGGVTQDDMDYMVATVLATVYGDADLDDDVDGADFDAWRIRDSLGGGIGWATGDWDGDNDVDGADFDHWRLRLPAIGGGGVAAVPEPAAWMLLTTAGLTLALAIRRR